MFLTWIKMLALWKRNVREKEAEGHRFETLAIKWRSCGMAVIAERWQWFPQPQLLLHELWHSPAECLRRDS